MEPCTTRGPLMGRWCTRPGRPARRSTRRGWPATRWWQRPRASPPVSRPSRRRRMGAATPRRSPSCAWRCSPEGCCSRCWACRGGIAVVARARRTHRTVGSRSRSPDARPTRRTSGGSVGLPLLSRGPPRPLDRPHQEYPDERTPRHRCPHGGPAAARRLRERLGRTRQRPSPRRPSTTARTSAFATDMLPHHAQALSMVDLTLGRKLDPEVAEPRRADPHHPGARDRDDGRLAQRVG